MTHVRIYKPAKTAMQSGKARTHKWVLRYDRTSQREIQQITGWTSSGDMPQQVRLEFDNEEQAVAYAKQHGLSYTIVEPHDSAPMPRAYADNFTRDPALR